MTNPTGATNDNPATDFGGDAPRRLELLATCTFGLEAVVVRELEDLGYRAVPLSTGRVMFEGDERAIVDANLHLRAADRVLIRIGSFPASTFDELFDGVKNLPWERWIAREAAFPVSGRCVRSQLASEPAVQRATKRAIVDRLMGLYVSQYSGTRAERGERGGERVLPETGPEVSIEVSILRDVATLTIDTSGAGLHKRGYRAGVPGEAALKETLAAGLVLLSVWRPGRPLLDPFCGSGTIAIEAALIGRNIAPGLNRPFAFESWVSPLDGQRPLIDADLVADAREDARSAIRAERLEPVIHASDIDEGALRLARVNARDAGVDQDIQFIKRDVRDLNSRREFGVIVTNPPYGVRLGDEREIEGLYRAMPTIFRNLPTWSFHIFTGRLDMERLFGQPAARRRKLYNSKIECCFFSFLGPKPPTAKREVAEQDDPVALPHSPDFSEVSEYTGDVAESMESYQQDEDSIVHEAAPIAPAIAAPESTRAREPLAPAFGGLRDRDVREGGDFGRCLANTLRHLRKYPSRGITCYRVYERDVPDVPLIIDRYGDWYHASEYEREHSRSAAQQADWFDLMRSTISEIAGVPISQVVMKEKHRQRGLSQHEKVADQRRTMVVVEGDPPLKFEINLTDYTDTGLFLDHRLTRQMIRERSAGKTVLNLFCYTGSFTVYAASGGAARSTSVDLSNTYLEWAQRNLGLNGLYAAKHELVRADVMAWLAEAAARRPGAYDLVIADPPTFSNSKSTQADWEVGDDHVKLLELIKPLLSPKGEVWFSTNFRKFKLDDQNLSAMGYQTREMSEKTVPPEYRNRKVHKSWLLRLGGDVG
ncbi:MAG: bifunctional 23S rRNA (guanine(2069)-N(7))-methyltransferase RlmK/23S rRNA (guanine(2445)-N(2))-methyltransferase RlmL [Phycisphaerales bacterium]|nr:bifunctional 23S rRNA (guanine(2069)-N(7))-methyltransferase RlmK/23S rRNA (guanine(2445)-N(2))-methyltransferase RlmL [Phycisphaerales bacterium]